jgi:dipeptidyl aminopeptidase/acylaminoacyl peptidase
MTLEIGMRIPHLVLALASITLFASRPLQVDDLFKVKRVADPQVSSTGDAAYQVGTVEMAANKTVNRIWLRHGAANRELDLGNGSQARPRFSPDGKRLSFLSGGQVWVQELATGQLRQLTSLSGGAEGQLWSPDGQWLAFVSTTIPTGVEADNAAYLKAKDADPVKARHYKTLMFRHWNEWKDPQQVSHLFVVKADGSEAPRDLTPGQAFDVPDFAGVAAGDDYAWSPDAQRLAYGAHPEQTKGISTNGEIYEVAVQGGPVRKVSVNPAMDSTPRYSPDGKYLAWRAQRRPGFEADRVELWVMERATGKVVSTTKAFDLHVGAFAWDGGKLLITAGEKGQVNLYRWDPAQPKPAPLTAGLHIEEFDLEAGNKALVRLSDTRTPPDLFEVDLATGKASRATAHNEALAADLGLNRAEALWFKGAAGNGDKGPQVLEWVVKPVGYDSAKKYPVAFIIHGGPQGSWDDAWHYRWNAQSWASRGFITVLPNPRGSTGFGQKFCDQISGDWNGRVIKDLMLGLDAVLKAYPNADPAKVVAAGGSYGGYAVNWIAGHYPDRFAAFVSHAGLFNLSSMNLVTEELWFPKWEFKGWYWESPKTKALWDRLSPSTGAAAFKKPMLVIHGEQDFRVPVDQGYQLFQVHQLRGVPSELLVFPDECHFIQKPRNAKLWYETVLGWFDTYGK